MSNQFAFCLPEENVHGPYRLPVFAFAIITDGRCPSGHTFDNIHYLRVPLMYAAATENINFGYFSIRIYFYFIKSSHLFFIT